MLRASIALLVLLLVACAPMTWNKPGASQNEFSQDRYDCMQQAQQRVSSALVNAYGGAASDQVITNANLFGSCMNAKGYYLQNNQQSIQPSQPQANPLKDADESAISEAKSVCAREDIKPYFNKSPCNALEISLEQMSDKSKISADEKVAVSKLRAENQTITNKLVDAYRRYGGVKGADIVMLWEKFEQLREKNVLDLYQGKINWGEYNHRRHELAVQFRDELNQIVRPK